jgi:putative redox protein
MPSRERITFTNTHGVRLAAALELPDRQPRAFALFAHCFTCGKDSAAASRISRSLTGSGIAVLRFDFTGLGGSQGDFGNAGFSANIDDLHAAAAYLREHHDAPQLLIGHSFGGTAVLAAAAGIEEVTAVVTIAAPASPEHVLKQFGASLEVIEREGSEVVTLGGREFVINRSFIDDLRSHPLQEQLRRLKCALLVLHAPLDDTVSIDEAGVIFTAARHPKSFISLDKADHLLTRLEDAQYVANTISAWADRYLANAEGSPRPEVDGGEVQVDEGNARFLRDVTTDDHAWLADEPRSAGGDNLGPDPYEHLLAALGTCTSMTIRMYANRKKWPLDDVQIQLQHSREHARDCEDCETKSVALEVLTRAIRLVGDLDESQKKRLLEIADRCPVHRTLTSQLRIDTVEWK